MKNPFKNGDQKIIKITVKKEDTASFESGEVHPVYATFALGRDAEWACRQFVLEMKEMNEEGIGTFLNIQHHSPALLGSEITIVATLDKVEKNKVICTYEVKCKDRLIASGTQGQAIIDKSKLEKLFESFNH